MGYANGDKVVTTGRIPLDNTKCVPAGLTGVVLGRDTDGKYKVAIDGEAEPWYLAEHEIGMAKSIQKKIAMSHEEVDKFEESLRGAENNVETAAQLMSDTPLVNEELRELWGLLNNTLNLIRESIHNAYILRPED